MKNQIIILLYISILILSILTGCVDQGKDESSSQASAIRPEQEEQYKSTSPGWDPNNPPYPANPDGTRG